ncbi:MAG: hypothetical protein Q7K55_09000 [Candidatus Levybacteria bacterium]|nr:hypothetical protein [Candidatus Levybacteria bacterium]
MKLVWQSLLLIFSFVSVYVWQKTILSGYTIQIFGFFIFLYLIVLFRKKGAPVKRLSFSNNESSAIYILNTVILLLIFSTNGFLSALFFLLYFMAFGIAFVFEPLTVFVFVIGTILIFLPDALKNDVMKNLIMLGSLGLISPIAFFFGREYKQDEKKDEHINKLEENAKNTSEKIKKDVEEILQEEEINPNEAEKLKDILEQSNKLQK